MDDVNVKKSVKEQIIAAAKEQFGDTKFAQHPIYLGLVRALGDFRDPEKHMSGTQLAAVFIAKQTALEASGARASAFDRKEDISYSLFLYMLLHRDRLERHQIRNKVQLIPNENAREFVYKVAEAIQKV